MQAKLQAIEKFQKIQQRQRDAMSQQLEVMRRQQEVAVEKLNQLAELKKQTTPWQGNDSLNREALINYSRVDQMLRKLINHQQHEQALMQAQCTSLQNQLQRKHLKVKCLETTLERWQKEHQLEQIKRQDLAFEELLNHRFAIKSN